MELKPCPFCGGDAKERLDDEGRPGDARCSLCGANGPWNMWEDCWNTRPAEDALREALDFYADEENWNVDDEGLPLTIPPTGAVEDRGAIARRALGKE